MGGGEAVAGTSTTTSEFSLETDPSLNLILTSWPAWPNKALGPLATMPTTLTKKAALHNRCVPSLPFERKKLYHSHLSKVLWPQTKMNTTAVTIFWHVFLDSLTSVG